MRGNDNNMYESRPNKKEYTHGKNDRIKLFSLLNNISQHVMHVRLNLLACLLAQFVTAHAIGKRRLAIPLSDSAGISIRIFLGCQFDSSCIVSLS